MLITIYKYETQNFLDLINFDDFFSYNYSLFCLRESC